LIGVYFQLIEKGMPRKARIDAAGALQHIIVHGIDHRKIFYNDMDRDAFSIDSTGIMAMLFRNSLTNFINISIPVPHLSGASRSPK
jgi:hypothetical protein